MMPFATEFPVKSFSKGEFVALVMGWLKGAGYSQVFLADGRSHFDKENMSLSASSGEELRFLEYEGADGTKAIGFRHDNPDNEERLWRTETVVCSNCTEGQQSVMRVRTQCIARSPDAVLHSPKKPYFIKTILSDGQAIADGYFALQEAPHHLKNDNFNLEIATEIVSGSASQFLPIVYFSRFDSGHLPMAGKEISDLSFQLGGIAHIVIEPDREFSFKLRERTDSENVYGGTVGVYIPGGRNARRFYIGGAISDAKELAEWISTFCVSVRSRIPASGWDWTELQERNLRRQRERDKNRLSVSEMEQLYIQEIDVLKERVEELEGRIQTESNDNLFGSGVSGASGTDLSFGLPQLYDGELGDRIRYLTETALSVAEPQGLDPRTVAVGEQLLMRNGPSDGLTRIRGSLKRATKDQKRSGPQMASVLVSLGFEQRVEGKHIRLLPTKELIGVDSVTIAKTPSDHRTPMNSYSQIEAALGITKL